MSSRLTIRPYTRMNSAVSILLNPGLIQSGLYGSGPSIALRQFHWQGTSNMNDATPDQDDDPDFHG